MAAPTGPWSEDLLQRNTPTGGNDGTAFNTVAPTSHLVKKITFWRKPAKKKDVQSLSQIKIEYTDGSSQTYGSPKGDLLEYDFNPGQKLTQASSYGNGGGSRTGRIKWKSDSGPDFDFGMPSNGSQTEFAYDIGSGFLVGIEGKSSDEINCLALIFLKQGINIKADPPSYDTSALKNIPQTIAHEQTFAWDGSPYEYTFGPDSSEITVTNSWSTTTSSSFGTSIGISYSPIPGFLTMSADFSYSYSSETTKSGSTTTDDKVSWERSGEIATEKDAMMTMTSSDGKTMTWTESGTAKQKMTTTVNIQAFEIDGKTPKTDKDADEDGAEGSEEEVEQSGEEAEESSEEEEEGSEPAAPDAEEEPEEDDEAEPEESGAEEEEPEEEDENENASGEEEEAEASEEEAGSEQEEEEPGSEEEEEEEEEPAPATKGKAKPTASKAPPTAPKAKPTVPVTKGKK